MRPEPSRPPVPLRRFAPARGRLAALGVLGVLLLAAALLGPAGARPGGGQSYRAPTRVSPPTRGSPSYHAPSYHSPTYVPVPVPVPSSRRYDSSPSGGGDSGYGGPSRGGGSALAGVIGFLIVVALILF